MENLIKGIEAKLDGLKSKGFNVMVKPYTIMGQNRWKIAIASSDKLINNVQGQYPDHISFSLTESLDFESQVFGGMGGGSLHRNINVNDEKEKFYAMKGVKVPFRKPQKNEKSILSAVEKLAVNYYKTLLEFKEQGLLRYSDLADYDNLLK